MLAGVQVSLAGTGMNTHRGFSVPICRQASLCAALTSGVWETETPMCTQNVPDTTLDFEIKGPQVTSLQEPRRNRNEGGAVVGR